MEPKKPDCACPEAGETCTSVSTQCADVSLPVRVKPYAVIDSVEVECCGDPTTAVRRAFGCGGCRCEITITQSVCIRIAVEYGAAAEAGEPSIFCRRPSEDGCPPCK